MSFTEGLSKAFTEGVKEGPTEFGRAVAGGAGKALVGAGVLAATAGAVAAYNAYRDSNLEGKFQDSLRKVMSTNPVVSAASDKARVLSYAATIFKFGPHVACDPNLLAYFLAAVVQGQGIDANIIRLIQDTEAKYKDSRSMGVASPVRIL